MKKAITVRVNDSVSNKLSELASREGLTRQDYLEKILTNISVESEGCITNEAISYVSSDVMNLINKELVRLPGGTKTSLKKLVGKDEWVKLTTTTRRVFGKQFIGMVIDGDFPCLSPNGKKSNNEQQYIVNK